MRKRANITARRQLTNQVRSLWPWLIGVVALIAMLGLTILAIHFGTDINVRYIVSDPSETALLPEYTGAYSHLGVLVLWTAAVTSILTGAVIRGHPNEEHLSSFFVQLGVLTG